MKLIVGLGNPGKEYDNTRHNIGFMTVDNYVSVNNLGEFKKKFNGLYLDASVNGERVLFVKPLSYMNLSGKVVKKFINYYNVDVSNLLVISDDLDQEIGKFKLKYKGSCGGHNGLRDIENQLGTTEYKRLKIGISNNKSIDTKDYVLSRITGEDMRIIRNVIDKSVLILDDYMNYDFERLMSKYN